MSILVVEDEVSLARLMQLELTHAGFDVATVSTAHDALRAVQARPFEAILLDVILPDLTGIEVCRRVRTQSDVPILMVTARSQVPDIVAALDLGADDYLVKPVNVEELAARIRAAIRRRAGSPPHGRVLECGDVIMARDEHRVEVHGASVELTLLEYQLLEFLLLHQNWVQSREALLDRVWQAAYAGETNMVDVTVSRLRKRLVEAGSALEIETVRGIGYVVRSRRPARSPCD